MKINDIIIENVKSFRDRTCVHFLTDFNILIGPNGSGKSNFMDILSIIIRRYFLKTYKIVESIYDNNMIAQTIQTDLFREKKLELQLEKYIGQENDESKIEISFLVQELDLCNIRTILKKQTLLQDILEKKYSFQNQHQYILTTVFHNFKQWPSKIEALNVDDKVKFTILNGKLDFVEHPGAQLFLEYLNCYELILLLSRDLDSSISLTTPYVYMGPNRIGNIGDYQVSLANANRFETMYQCMLGTSRNGGSLLGMSTLHFAQKHRIYESDSKGYLLRWNEDPEVKNVSEFLKVIHYQWDMRNLNPNNNTYEITLIENNQREIPLSQASSGEREIINFLLGIYALNIRGGVVIIDEPELHLHPHWQKLLLKLFKRFSEELNTQFVISTHAPAFISAESYDHIFRIYKDKNKVSKITPFQIQKDIPIKILNQIINGTNNEQMFFADLVLLVEGITDKLIFQNIVTIVQNEIQDTRVVEVVEIKGKTNNGYFRTFLDALNIPNYFIADLDYVCQTDANEEIKALLYPKPSKIIKDVVLNPKSNDGQKLYDLIDRAICNKDFDALAIVWENIKAARRQINYENLNSENKNKLEKYIDTYSEKTKTYILPKGAIESYLPKGFKGKDLTKVLELLYERKYSQEWQSTSMYEDLKKLIKQILIK